MHDERLAEDLPAQIEAANAAYHAKKEVVQELASALASTVTEGIAEDLEHKEMFWRRSVEQGTKRIEKV